LDRWKGTGSTVKSDNLDYQDGPDLKRNKKQRLGAGRQSREGADKKSRGSNRAMRKPMRKEKGGQGWGSNNVTEKDPGTNFSPKNGLWRVA